MSKLPIPVYLIALLIPLLINKTKNITTTNIETPSPISNTYSLSIIPFKYGFNLGKTESCVTPVFLKGDVPEAMVLVKDLREKYNIFCSIVVYPVIPKGLILLRLIPTATHTVEDIDETLNSFSEIREKLTVGYYRKISEKFKAD